jgi:hypothetical protein
MRDRKGTEEGIYDETFSQRSDRVDVAGNAKETVEGSESPGKDDRRIFTCDAILVRLIIQSTCVLISWISVSGFHAEIFQYAEVKRC